MKKLMFFIMGMLFLSFSSATIWTDSLESNVHSAFLLNENSGSTLEDYFNDTNLTAFNTPTLGSVGILNNSVNFTNANEYLGNITTVDLNNTNISVSLWVNVHSIDNSDTLFVLWTGASQDDLLGILFPNSTYLRGTFYDGTSHTINYEINNFFGSWNHIGFTVSNNQMALYLNGLSIGNLTASIGLLQNVTNQLTVGNGDSRTQTRAVNGAIDETIIWRRYLTQSEMSDLYNSGIGLNPTFQNLPDLISPTNNTNTLSDTNYFVANHTPKTGYNLTNTTLHVWYSNGTILGNNFTTLSGDSNTQTNLSLNNLTTYTDYLWNYETCYNETGTGTTSCNYSIVNRSLTRERYIVNSISFNATSYHTATENLVLNITTDQALTNGLLLFNGTEHVTTTTNPSGNIYILTKELTHGTSNIGNKSFFFNFTLDSVQYSSDTNYQNVKAIDLSYCNSGTPFLNISFKDESSLSLINATIPSSTFIYYLGDGSETKTLSYSNSTKNYYYAFCFNETSERLSIDPIVQYKNDPSYPQRIWNPSASVYTNISTNETLYLLNTTVGGSVTFQVADGANNLISGVDVTVERIINSSYTLISSGTTGSGGLVTFFLDSNFEHRINASKTGFSTQSILLFPTQSTYTITLGTSTANQLTNYETGVTISIKPSITQTLNNGTSYEFNMTITSSQYDLEKFGFFLLDENGSVITSVNSTVTSGGTVQVTQNTGTYKSITMQYFFIVNGTTTTYYADYNIFNTIYQSWSIKNFFNDLDSYLDSGIFGLDDFGLNIIIYLVIFLSVGIMSYKYGVNNPAVFSIILFAIVYFFDVAVDIIPEPFGVKNLFTVIVALIAIAVSIREVMSR